MARENAQRALQSILKSEGYYTKGRGWMNDPSDSGGPTIAGVTWRNFCDYYGINPRSVNWRSPEFHARMKAMPDDDIFDFYYRKKLAPIRFDELPPGIDLSVADAATLHGQRQAILFLQRAVGVVDDGKIGPQTLKAARDHPDWDEVIENMHAQRTRFYHNLVARRPKDRKWLRGWLNRNRRVQVLAMEIAPDAHERQGVVSLASATDLGRPQPADEQEIRDDRELWGEAFGDEVWT